MKESNKSRREAQAKCRQKIAEIQSHSLTDDQLLRIISFVVAFLIVIAII